MQVEVAATRQLGGVLVGALEKKALGVHFTSFGRTRQPATTHICFDWLLVDALRGVTILCNVITWLACDRWWDSVNTEIHHKSLQPLRFLLNDSLGVARRDGH